MLFISQDQISFFSASKPPSNEISCIILNLKHNKVSFLHTLHLISLRALTVCSDIQWVVGAKSCGKFGLTFQVFRLSLTVTTQTLYSSGCRIDSQIESGKGLIYILQYGVCSFIKIIACYQEQRLFFSVLPYYA